MSLRDKSATTLIKKTEQWNSLHEIEKKMLPWPGFSQDEAVINVFVPKFFRNITRDLCKTSNLRSNRGARKFKPQEYL
jgi:hypothetical protein